MNAASLPFDIERELPFPDPSFKNVFVFDHIPKCAGTSLHAMFDRDFPGYEHIESPISCISFADKVNASTCSSLYCGGHYVYGIHELLNADCKVYYITFLRNPLAVAYSLYRYGMQTKLYSYGSFVDYLFDNPYISMVRHLGGTVERAIARLENYFFIGFVEQLRESVFALGKALGISFGDIPFRNQSQNNPRTPCAHIRTETIQKYCHDFAVYEYFSGKITFPPVHARAISPTDVSATGSCRAVDDWHNGPSSKNNPTTGLKLETNDNTDDNIYTSLLLAKINAAMDDATFHFLLEGIRKGARLTISPHQVTTPERFRALFEILKTLLGKSSCDRNTCVSIEAGHLFCTLASSPYARRMGLDLDMAKRNATRFPFRHSAHFQLAQLQRQHGETENALTTLERIPPDARWTTFTNEYMANLSCRRDDPLGILEHLAPEAVTPQKRALAFLEDNFECSRRVRLAALPAGNTLIVASGPVILLEDLLASLPRDLPGQSLLLPKRNFREKYAAWDVFLFDGWFVPNHHYPWTDALLSKGFKNVVLLCSDFAALNNIQNFIDFFALLPQASIYAYMMSNIFADRHKKSLIGLRTHRQPPV
ncbi:hypothetical protein G3N56_08030 [Desulfovibrio sulfodismutans]|uniref:Sulfotransferase family protein n=1 Tax=Desulfolutivibrio sulfodismutans TaxID=63561 RepID=A0A7K3NKI3_9BACT|nr:hypothetical protein [Desulfolutivibrio sulfodismutans]NDY56690.1 hypothetical protein [Desulfolutivibrio sulfodismutans]QLA13505.1 hypothetical protein GD606_15150 [Desulfolutivibrio sulfodismutans DSM 3696]